jgi:hypothetical protein
VRPSHVLLDCQCAAANTLAAQNYLTVSVQQPSLWQHKDKVLARSSHAIQLPLTAFMATCATGVHRDGPLLSTVP